MPDGQLQVGASASYLDAKRQTIDLKDFADRRSVLEAIEDPVRIAIARGIADPARIGITGLSDGSSTVGFALLHSTLFSAYAMSSCCWDTNLAMRVGPSAARIFYDMGYPRTVDDSPTATAFWKGIAFTPNARHIRGPILVQVADDEYLSAPQTFTALRERDRLVRLLAEQEQGARSRRGGRAVGSDARDTCTAGGRVGGQGAETLRPPDDRIYVI